MTKTQHTYSYVAGQAPHQFGMFVYASGGILGSVVGLTARESTLPLRIFGVTAFAIGFLIAASFFVRGFFTKVVVSHDGVCIQRPFRRFNIPIDECVEFTLDRCTVRPGFVVRLHRKSSRPVRTSIMALTSLEGRMLKRNQRNIDGILKKMNGDLQSFKTMSTAS